MSCPICGGPGADLVVAFYCDNPACQNYRASAFETADTGVHVCNGPWEMAWYAAQDHYSTPFQLYTPGYYEGCIYGYADRNNDGLSAATWYSCIPKDTIDWWISQGHGPLHTQEKWGGLMWPNTIPNFTYLEAAIEEALRRTTIPWKEGLKP